MRLAQDVCSGLVGSRLPGPVVFGQYGARGCRRLRAALPTGVQFSRFEKRWLRLEYLAHLATRSRRTLTSDLSHGLYAAVVSGKACRPATSWPDDTLQSLSIRSGADPSPCSSHYSSPPSPASSTLYDMCRAVK